MEDECGTNLWNKVMDLYLEKRDAVNKIRKFFNHCQKNGFKPMLYYTGHGEIGTGNWCFNDGTLSIQEIDDMLPGECYYPTIVSDACYSGHWANYCLKKDINGFKCLSASPEYSVAIDRPSKSLRTECSLRALGGMIIFRVFLCKLFLFVCLFYQGFGIRIRLACTKLSI